ncbi:hypothetical protein HMPREF0580_1031 [Mobiluncus mulieris ATCC 35239]|uniref:Uncharacterized protein n=1 Tax=Mobiluncus mulieris ATCC 35239 TaxID=871571 RepID=E0QQ66_9ACTO|nr:hypothetical protein HMPREF0580_1031 [Mobiluncus mulieris ATCC 35239]
MHCREVPTAEIIKILGCVVAMFTQPRRPVEKLPIPRPNH